MLAAAGAVVGTDVGEVRAVASWQVGGARGVGIARQWGEGEAGGSGGVCWLTADSSPSSTQRRVAGGYVGADSGLGE